MAPSPSTRVLSTPVFDPHLELRRARRHFAQTGRLDYFDLPYPDRELARRAQRNQRKYLIHKQYTVHTCTEAHSTTPHTQSGGLTTVIHQEQERPYADSGSDSDGDRTPYDMQGIVAAERAYRDSIGITQADYGTRWRAAFRTLTGDTPVCGPGERDKAAVYLYRVEQAIAQGGWTPGEWQSLRKLRTRWMARAEGTDARFEVVGTYTGRPSAQQRAEIHDRRVMAEIAILAKR